MIGLRPLLALVLSLSAALTIVAAPAKAEILAEGASAFESGSPRVKLTLLSDQEQVAPSGKVRIGVLFKLDPDWQIGRASCRERGGDAGGSRVVIRKKWRKRDA